jgi:hypothetical protein
MRRRLDVDPETMSFLTGIPVDKIKEERKFYNFWKETCERLEEFSPRVKFIGFKNTNENNRDLN